MHLCAKRGCLIFIRQPLFEWLNGVSLLSGGSLILDLALVDQAGVAGQINPVVGIADDQVAAFELNGHVLSLAAVTVFHRRDHRGARACAARPCLAVAAFPDAHFQRNKIKKRMSHKILRKHMNKTKKIKRYLIIKRLLIQIFILKLRQINKL